MDYTKYFKTKQKILLKTMALEQPIRSEVVTAYLVRCCEDFFELELPYLFSNGKDQLFDNGSKICLLSEAFGMGVQLTGHFQARTGETTFRIIPHDDFELFGRREYCRIGLHAGLYCTWRGRNLDAVREGWFAAVQSSEAGNPLPVVFIPIDSTQPERRRTFPPAFFLRSSRRTLSATAYPS